MAAPQPPPPPGQGQGSTFVSLQRRPMAFDVARPHQLPGLGPVAGGGSGGGTAAALDPSHPSHPAYARVAPPLAPYAVPAPDGRCWFLEMPEEVLVRVLGLLGRGDMTRCKRVCKDLHTMLEDDPNLALRHLLLSSNLELNPHALRAVPEAPERAPPAPKELLGMLRRRLAGFGAAGSASGSAGSGSASGVGAGAPSGSSEGAVGSTGQGKKGKAATGTGAEKTTGAQGLVPRRRTEIELREPEGRLYEYLEGVLLRGVGGGMDLPKEIAVYDLRELGEWEDEEEDVDGDGDEVEVEGGDGQRDEEMDVAEDGVGGETHEVVDEDDLVSTIRTTKKFDFEIAEFAVDPGQDLLVLVEVRGGDRSYRMYFHLLTLSTFEPHPRARTTPLQWPTELRRRTVSLGFQLCDDGLYALYHNGRQGVTDQICAWQWTTGRLAASLRAFPTMSFESFILLKPNVLVVPVVNTHLDTESLVIGDINDISDLSWRHHLYIYAFPPFSSVPLPADPSEPLPPPHRPANVLVVDMPEFTINLQNDVPPPRMTIRTDPPPRQTLPSHPRGGVQPFAPEPESGVVVLEFHCQVGDEQPHYVLVLPKKELLRLTPERSERQLKSADHDKLPATVVPWERIAPRARLFGPDMVAASWVCYVYQDRYVSPMATDGTVDRFRLFDFDPRRVRREVLRRRYARGLVSVDDKEGEVSSPIATSPVASPVASTSASPTSSTMPGAFPPVSPTSPTSPASPATTERRGFLRRLSSTFKRTRLHAPEEDKEKERRAVRVAAECDGEEGGVTLVTAETVVPADALLEREMRTGSEFPYLFAERAATSDVVLIDEERVVIVQGDNADQEEDGPMGWNWARPQRSRLEVLEF